MSKKKKEQVDLKVDFGCGPNKREGFVGCDVLSFPNVDYVFDIGKEKFPFEDASVSEAHASHFVEHLDAAERVHFVNELFRVMKKGAKATIIVPHWASCRAYGDLTHKWPPVSEFWFYYLDKGWRAGNAPHSVYNADVDFACTWGYNLRQDVTLRNQEYQQFAMQNYKEVVQDIVATFVKK
jgi:ubiquinone/menaquinone biosynthesis C-methylase UbiE